MKILIFFLLLTSISFGDNVITIATYNVENLFDLKKSGFEYEEYIPNTTSEWNQKNYEKKLKNISKVIRDINPDIIALQEIESYEAFIDLKNQLKRDGLYYRYFALADAKNTTVKVGVFSKYKIIYKKEISINATFKYRNILETKIDVEGNDLYLFTNHWKSKAGKESERILSAKKLYQRIEEIGFDKNIILAGDFNSDYEENKKIDKNHNDTNSRTGINDVLQTKALSSSADSILPLKGYLYNLWYDTDIDKRYSYTYKKRKEAIDSIIITPALISNKNFYYSGKTITNCEQEYLMNGNQTYRWQLSKRKPYKHLGKGYSDHLPILAKFSVMQKGQGDKDIQSLSYDK
jgi:predicted extracellular nuclease